MSEHFESTPALHVEPFVFQGDDSKSMYFALHELQSRMHNSRPHDLVVDYTKTMMGFLTLIHQPRHIAMVGLGGGSLAKFCYRHLPETKITVIEINPYVIALRREFQVPDDDDRFNVIEDDGAKYLRNTQTGFDVILVDGFDHQGQPAQLCSQSFYDDCHSALVMPGVMVVNLHGTHTHHETFITRIGLSFDGNFSEAEANPYGNVIVFAGKGIPISL